MQPGDAGNAETAAQAALREFNARSSELRDRALRMQGELAALSETVRSGDGLATVTVGAGGIMRDLRIGGGSAANPERIRQAVMSAYQQGCRAIGQKAADITERFAPGSPAVAMMRDAVPPDPEPDDDERITVGENVLDGVERGRTNGGTFR